LTTAANPASEYTIGLDVGGTKLLGILMNRRADILLRRHAPTPKGNETVAAAITAILAELVSASIEMGIQPAGIGICVPGFVDPKQGLVVHADNLEISSLHLKDAVQPYFEIPVRVSHDVKSSALGEALYGAGIGRHDFAYLNLGTGVSVGLFLNGKVYSGAAGKAGEIGQFCVQPRGYGHMSQPEDRLEAQASGPALVRSTAAALSAGKPSMIEKIGEGQLHQVSPQIIGQAAQQGDELAARILQQAADVLGVAVAGMIDLLDLECVIVGGGVAQLGRTILDPLEESVNRYLMVENQGQIPILPSALGSNAGAIGAAAAFFSEVIAC
jgi:glucokinase